MSDFASIGLAIPMVSAFLAGYIGVLTVGKKEIPLAEKIKRYTAWNPPSVKVMEKKNLKKILTILAQLTPGRWSRNFDKELQQAGIPLTGGEFFALQGVSFFLFFILATLLSGKLLAGILLGIIALFLPRLWLNIARNRRKKQFNNQLADSLLILANSLRAGFSFLQAMETVSQEMPDPISTEYKVTLREMTYGSSTETALAHLAERVNSEDLDLMVTAVLIQRQVGGNLSEVLTNIHNTIQDRLRIQQEIKTLTAQTRTSGYIIGGLPFAIAGILSVVSPGYLGILFSETLGFILIGCMLFSQVIGFLIIRKIVSIKV